MQKQEFMKKLRHELRWHLSSADLHKVMQEYNGYFATAATNGGDEATAAAELGDPVLVASEVLSERGVAAIEVRHSKQRLMAFYLILIISTWIFVIDSLSIRMLWLDFFGITTIKVIELVILLLLLPTTLVLLLGLGREYNRVHIKIDWLFAINIITTAIIWVLWYSAFFLPLITLTYLPSTPTVHWLFWDVSPDALGPVFAVKLRLLSLITIVFIVAAGRRINHGQLIYIPLIYLNCTTLCGLYEYTMILHSMSDPAALPQVMGDIMLHLAIGVLISAAVAVLLLLRRRRASL